MERAGNLWSPAGDSVWPFDGAALLQATTAVLHEAATEAGVHMDDMHTSFKYLAYTTTGGRLHFRLRQLGVPTGMLTRTLPC